MTTVLLRRNADVTAVDDAGRTAVDLAQTRWIQAALRQAWNDAKRPELDAAAAAADLVASTVLPARSAVESPSDEQQRSSSSVAAATAPRLRSSGKLVRPFERSRSLDQPQRGDVATTTRVRLSTIC